MGVLTPAFIDEEKDAVDKVLQGALEVQSIDFCIAKNGETHHTSKFDLMTRSEDKCLVVRRGQTFSLDLLLNRPYDDSKDVISFIFYVSDVKTPGPSGETSAAVALLEKGSETCKTWCATFESQVDNHLTVAVTPAADCIVASWNLEVDTKLRDGGSLSYQHPSPIYVLFNPWCENDTVYMPEQSHREEYILEDAGLLYVGGYPSVRPSPWNYAQFEKDILDCALYLVRVVGKVKGRARSDPIRTSRALSAAMNVQDDNGIVFGNWASDPSGYNGGTAPWKWVGSLAIVQKYYEKKKSVKYGQCWVFAGVLTTICRALGIPCRPVSGFNAAHDSEGSLTIDVVVDGEGNDVDDFSTDSVWNFHVWNEVWMKRPDLGPEYEGWQAVDGTPQETSEDMFRCGPASLKAIKAGEVQRPYDATYVFAQVNADRVLWKYTKETQSFELISSDEQIIGKMISTKAIGKMEREDITDSYKYPEYSREERKTMEKVLRKSEVFFSRYYLSQKFYDVLFSVELQDGVKIGQDFSVDLRVTNKSASDSHQIKGILRADTVTYRGVTIDEVKRHEFDINVAPGTEEIVKMTVIFDEYYKKLVDQGSFKIFCLPTIVDKKYDWYEQKDFRVINPDIDITYDGEPVYRKEFTVQLKVENPLPMPLTKGKFYIQGTGLGKQLKIVLDKDVAPGEFATAEFKLTPIRTGRHQISAKFISNEIHNIDGFLSFEVNRHLEVNGTNGVYNEDENNLI